MNKAESRDARAVVHRNWKGGGALCYASSVVGLKIGSNFILIIGHISLLYIISSNVDNITYMISLCYSILCT